MLRKNREKSYIRSYNFFLTKREKAYQEKHNNFTLKWKSTMNKTRRESNKRKDWTNKDGEKMS